MISKELLSTINTGLETASLSKENLGLLVKSFAIVDSLRTDSYLPAFYDSVYSTSDEGWISFLKMCKIEPQDSVSKERSLTHIAQARLILDSLLCLLTRNGLLQTDMKYTTRDACEFARSLCKDVEGAVFTFHNDMLTEEEYLTEISKLKFPVSYDGLLENILSYIETVDANGEHFDRKMFSSVYYDGDAGKGFTFSKKPTPHITENELLKIVYFQVLEGYFVWAEKSITRCIRMMRIRRHFDTLNSLTVYIPKEFMKVCPNHNTYLQDVYNRLFRQGYGNAKDSIINLLKFVGVAYKEGI